jgi:hypothetical protein
MAESSSRVRDTQQKNYNRDQFRWRHSRLSAKRTCQLCGVAHSPGVCSAKSPDR